MANEAQSQQIRTGIKLFSIGGIEIRIDYSWFIIFLLVLWSLSMGYFPRIMPEQTPAAYWITGAIATLLFFLSILTHELAHAFVAIRSGMKIPAITLFVFGGMAHLAEEARTPKTEFRIAVVGPITSFLLAGIFWLLRVASGGVLEGLSVAVLEYLAWINLALAIFNLIPGFPLDGGRIFRALWWHRTGSLQRATRVAADIGKGFAVALMIFGALQLFAGILIGGIWLIFIGMFLRGLAEGGYQELVLRQSLEEVHAEEMMVAEVVSIGFPVSRDGNVVGVISLNEVKQVPDQERARKPVDEVMIPSGPRIQIAPDATLADALKKMAREQVGRLLVMQDSHMAGMITRTGLLRYVELRNTLGV
jgi:Zn-dependent protease